MKINDYMLIQNEVYKIKKLYTVNKIEMAVVENKKGVIYFFELDDLKIIDTAEYPEYFI